MATLEELVTPETAESLDEQQLALLQASDLPTTSWHSVSVPRVLLEVFSEVAADAWYSVAQIANGVIRERSTGLWLDAYATSQYDEERNAATFTLGTVTLTDHGGGPHTITAGVTTFATAGQALKFRATTGGTLALNGTLDVDVVGYAAGAAYNVPNGTIVELVSSLPTVTVDNPEIGLTGTWITTLGSDVESDSVLRTRLPLKWATLSTGSPPAAYISKALAVVGVTRAAIDDANPDGPGTNRVYIDNAGAVAALQTVLDGFAPSGTTSTAMAATAQAIVVPAVLTVQRAYRAAAEAAHVTALTDLAAEIAIGGTVVKSEVIERLMAPDGMVDVEIGGAWAANSGQNIVLDLDSYPQFTASFSYVEV